MQIGHNSEGWRGAKGRKNFDTTERIINEGEMGIAVKPKQTRGRKFHWIFEAESMRLLLDSRQCPPTSTRSRPAPSTRAFTANLFTCQPPSYPLPDCVALVPRCPPGSRLACPPGSADGVIYCYQTLEHIKHFITCQSAASNNPPAGPARQQTKRK